MQSHPCRNILCITPSVILSEAKIPICHPRASPRQDSSLRSRMTGGGVAKDLDWDFCVVEVLVRECAPRTSRSKTASAIGARSGICKRFLTRRLQKLHLIVSGKKIVNRPSVGCDVMPHAATAPSYINKFSHNVISSLCLPGVSRTSPPTDGQIAALLAFASRIVQRLSRH